MGSNIVRLLKKYVCLAVKTNVINDAIELIHENMERIMKEKNKGEDRQHIVLRSRLLLIFQITTMLKNTFCHIPGIRERTENHLWSSWLNHVVLDTGYFLYIL